MRPLAHIAAYLFLALALVVLPGCTSVETLVENGNYEEAIRTAQRRLTGKQKKNPKYVAALESAVNRANERDVERAGRMKRSGNPDWTEIHAIYDKLLRRQNALRPLLPLVDKNGYQAEFRFARVEPLAAEAAGRAADQLYAEGNRLLARGRQGDKLAARNAHATFADIEDYRSNYRDAYTLAREAGELGITYVAVEVENRSGGYLPAGFERELLRFNTSNLNDRWRVYDFTPDRNRDYDFTARFLIDDIAVSPDRYQERAYVDEREITDGKEYVLDANGNVAKDTLGNDITRPRRIIVRAEVLEVLQTKSAVVNGSLELYDRRDRRLVDREALTARAIFEHYASTFRGDDRALSKDSRRRIGNRPLPFPTDEALVLEAAEQLKPRLQDELRRSARSI